MKYQIFQYPLPCESEPAELNRFLANHRIAGVVQHLVEVGGTPTLVFVVQVAGGAVLEETKKPPRIDYREVLTPEHFARYSQLREFRKDLAAAEGLPVYGVFTNAQLAEIVKQNVKTKGELGEIKGLGTARIEKYGESLLSFLEKTGKSLTEEEVVG